MDIQTKKIVARYAREEKNKLELVMNFKEATQSELKEINLFYNVCKEILQLHKKGESEETIKKVLVKLGYDEGELDLIIGKKEPDYYLKRIGLVIMSLVFVIIISLVFGTMFFNIFSQTEWDFLRKDYEIEGMIFGEDTNFDDLEITSNVVVKNFLVNRNEYKATIRCLDKITLNFSKEGFVPLYKTISCEEQKLDLVFFKLNDFKKVDLGEGSIVEDRGMKIELKGVDLAGNGEKLVSNPIVSITSFNPNNLSEMIYFPGELEGLRKDGNIIAFESYGFAKIVARDENKNNLDLREGTSAKIIFPLHENQKANSPEEMPLWYFDEVRGIWREEGSAKKVCEKNVCNYLGEINKINSFWSINEPKQKIFLKINSFQFPSKLFNKELTEFDKYKLIIKSSQAFNSFKINFKDFNKEKIIEVVPPIKSMFFTINDIPSNEISYDSTKDSVDNYIMVEGFSLENCKFWESDAQKFSSCISNFDSLNGLSKEQAFNFVKESNFVEREKSKIFVNLAKHYSYILPCYSAMKGDCFSGVACIKMLDENKSIDSGQIISNILSQNLGEKELSFVLNNLSEYYWDINYCYPISISTQKEACINKFPKAPEIIDPIDLCGNGVIEGREKCDGNNFGGLSCESFGFNRGKLACIKCQINKSGCYNSYEPTKPTEGEQTEPTEPSITPICGNNIVEGNEDCDGTDFGELGCVDFGFNSGNLVCENCRINTTNCDNKILQTCGNGVIEVSEECEGNNFNGKTCEQYGFDFGELFCNNCKIDASGCKNEVVSYPEIDPLELFECPFNTSYASPIKDNYSQSFWIKVIHNSKVFAYRVPFKKSECVGETVLKEDSEGNLVPCITGFANDGCIIEKRELGSISGSKNYYIDVSKHEDVYKQNPVDFASNDGNIFFLIKNEGEEEFIKFSSTNEEQIQKIQVYDSNDYVNRLIPSVKRAFVSGNVIWVVLNGVLHNVYVDRDSSCGNSLSCINTPFTSYLFEGTNSSGTGTTKYEDVFGWGKVFIALNSSSGKVLTKVKNKVFCHKNCDCPFDEGECEGNAYLNGVDFDPTKWTYAGDGYGKLLVRANTNILEYSTSSDDVNKPAFIR